MLALDRECRKGIISDLIEAQRRAYELRDFELVNNIGVAITELTMRGSAEKLPAVEEYMLRLVSEGG